MPLTLKQSEIDALPFDFRKAVDEHVAALQAYRAEPTGAPPTAHPWVEQTIWYDDQTVRSSFTILDDTPTLDERKAALLQRIGEAHVAADSAVLSPARRALLNIDAGAAFQAPEEERTDEQKALIANKADLDAKSAANVRHAALLGIEVEELTADTIDGWALAPFPNA